MTGIQYLASAPADSPIAPFIRPTDVASLTIHLDHLNNRQPAGLLDNADVMAFVSGLLTTFIAGFLPARKASRVDPVAILRGT